MVFGVCLGSAYVFNLIAGQMSSRREKVCLCGKEKIRDRCNPFKTDSFFVMLGHIETIKTTILKKLSSRRLIIESFLEKTCKDTYT